MKGKELGLSYHLISGMGSYLKKKGNHLSHGHDFTRAYALYVNKRRSGNGINAEAVERSLRLVYNRTAFQKTRLYQHLRDWERSSGHALFA